jgi:glutathione reductase (NADPH)
VNEEVDRLNAVYIRLLEGAGVKLHMGRGRLMDRHTIEVGGETDHRRQDPGRDRRPPEVPPIPGTSSRSPRTRRSICPTAAQAHHHRRRRLHRRRVRRHLPRAGLPGRLVIRRDRVLRGFDEECRTVCTTG